MIFLTRTYAVVVAHRDTTIYLQSVEDIKNMIKGLNPKGRNLRNETILKFYVEFNWTLQKIGEEYGLTRERVRQIINRQLKRSAVKTEK